MRRALLAALALGSCSSVELEIDPRVFTLPLGQRQEIRVGLSGVDHAQLALWHFRIELDPAQLWLDMDPAENGATTVTVQCAEDSNGAAGAQGSFSFQIVASDGDQEVRDQVEVTCAPPMLGFDPTSIEEAIGNTTSVVVYPPTLMDRIVGVRADADLLTLVALGFNNFGGDYPGIEVTCRVPGDWSFQIFATVEGTSDTRSTTVTVKCLDPSKTAWVRLVPLGGGGTVESVPLHKGFPPGLSCGTYGDWCTRPYPLGTRLVLKTMPDDGHRFWRWGGDCSGSRQPYERVVDGDLTCTFTFEEPGSFELSVDVYGPGTVHVLPSGDDCRSRCAWQYDVATDVTLRATPDPGAVLLQTIGDCSFVDGSASLQVTGLNFCDLVFGHTLTVTKDGEGGGRVTSVPARIDCGATCTAGFAVNSTVVLTAISDPGSTPVVWGGDCGPDGTVTVADRNATCTATFELAGHDRLTVVRAGSGTGTVTASVEGAPLFECGDVCAKSVVDGAVVTLAATADSGSDFTGWSGDCSGSSGSIQVTMDQARTCTATFARVHRLEIRIVGAGVGSVHVTLPGGASDCPGGPCTFGVDEGAPVTLDAVAADGSFFAGWSAGCSSAFTLANDLVCTATFDVLQPTPFPVNITISGLGLGDVTSNQAGLDCTGSCLGAVASYLSGTVVTFTAVAGADSVFAGWHGDCSGTDATATITVTRAMTCTAEFESLLSASLTVTKTGSGGGTVTSAPAGINCGTLDCFTIFAHGTPVTLTATADSGSHFTSWGGDCASAGAHPTATLTMDANASCSAQFDLGPPPPQTLTVTKSGAGHGTVASNPAGISCGATCSASFPGGSTVTLSATPDAGSKLVGWSGDCVPSAVFPLQATATMFGAQTCNAELEPVAVSVTLTGGGSGRVTSSPAGIDCGTSCSAPFVAGGSVTLTAAPSSGSYFAGWSGDCSGTGAAHLTVRTADLACSADFEPQPRLRVTKSGTGTGTVTSSPGGISCGATCSAGFDPGTMVTLGASADSGSTFAGWSGACASDGTVTLGTSNATCTATFNTMTSSCGSITVAHDGPTLYINATLANAGSGSYYWSYSWLATQPPPGNASTSIAAPGPGTYTISVFIVGPECSTETMITL